MQFVLWNKRMWLSVKKKKKKKRERERECDYNVYIWKLN